MNYFRILPAAASVIALTSVTCFARDQRENEEADSNRTRVMVHSPAPKSAKNPVPPQAGNQAGYIYLVEVERGKKTKMVEIDAHTGNVLSQHIVTGKA